MSALVSFVRTLAHDWEEEFEVRLTWVEMIGCALLSVVVMYLLGFAALVADAAIAGAS